MKKIKKNSPFNGQGWIISRNKPGFKVSIFTFTKIVLVFNWNSKPWCNTWSWFISRGCFHLQRFKLGNFLKGILLHFPRNLRSQNKTRFLSASKWAGNGISTLLICCPTFIGTRVCSIAVQNVQDNNAKIMEGPVE